MEINTLKNRIGLHLFEKHHGRKNIGSSRIRGHWLANNWEEAEIFKMGNDYDVCLYQKSYWVQHAKNFKGIKILDICDPDWLHWSHQFMEMIEEVDAITTSTEELAKSIRNFTDKKVICIPDRLDLSLYKGRKFHAGQAQSVVWFGYSSGFDMVKSTLNFLKKHKLDLIVIADKGFIMPSGYNDINLTNYKWNIDTVNDDIRNGDIVINPQGNNGKWKYKSNNKTLTSWALGMPVATNLDELKKFLDPDERTKEVELRRKELKEKWDIKQSIREYQNLIESIQNKK